MDFFKDFIFPGRLFWRMLLCPANKLKIPQLKSWGYCDPRELMVYANMQVLEQFWKEKPEELVCWKVDEDGNDIGPRIKSTLFPEINGMYAIDVIHMADDIFKKEIPQLNKQLEFMYDLMTLISPKMLLKDKEGNSTSNEIGKKVNFRDYRGMLTYASGTTNSSGKFTLTNIRGMNYKIEIDGQMTPITSIKSSGNYKIRRSGSGIVIEKI